MRKKLVLAGLVGIVIGLVIGRSCAHRPAPAAREKTATAPAAAQVWTCSMHPQIRQPKQGKCPICGMDLILAAAESPGADDGARNLVLSRTARALAEVETAPAERRFVDTELRLSGKVQLDETRLAYVTARVPGRIDRLYANVTGTAVKKGEHLADLYSPELIAAQQELIQAARAAGAGGRADMDSLLVAGRDKLRLWGLTAEQIGAIERGGQVRDHLTFYAPIGGVIVAKEALEGMYVETGMRLFTVADLIRLWVKLDAYESDLAAIRYGQPVEFGVEAYPGETFHGTVALVDPVLDSMTRTVKVRLNVINTDGRLKPEMFVHAVLRARLGAGGAVVAPDLTGKWLCTMHPDVIEDESGACPVCGMPLVSGPEAGFGVRSAAPEPALVIPDTAPLVTGARAVVYVAVPGEEGRFEGREIALGPRASRWYVVISGLREGERVVSRGAFKIDSSLQIEGKPSMMQPEEGGQ